MSLYAADSEDQVVSAYCAAKDKEYSCLECACPVRLRLGKERQPHFFHLKKQNKCRSSGKSACHLFIQQMLFNALPRGEACMEQRFPTIARVADLAWHPQHIVFEVQCSPISEQEIQARECAYASLGLQVVWILHERTYNKWRVSAAEQFLLRSPHYFTNIDPKHPGGSVYDQLSLITHGVRCWRLPRRPVDLTSPLPMPLLEEKNLPEALLERTGNWKLSFEGDWIQGAALPTAVFELFLAREQEVKNTKKSFGFLLGVRRLTKLFFWKLLKCISTT